MIGILQKAMADLRSAFSKPRRSCAVRPWFPEDDLLETQSSYHDEIDAGLFQLDQFRPLQPNPVTISILGTQLALENRSRKNFTIVNTGTSVVYIGFGFVPTLTNYTHSLFPCTASDDAKGATLIDQEWTGAIYAIVGGGNNPTVNYTEQQKSYSDLVREQGLR